MSSHTLIEWCDSTINPTSGCDGCELYRPGMQNPACYARQIHENRLAHSFPDKYAASFNEVRMIPGRMAQAAAWQDLRGKARLDKPWFNGFPRIIFVGDLGDFMSRAVPDDFLLEEVVEVIKNKQGDRHFWMLLTKRPDRLARFTYLHGPLPSNVMALCSVTTQATAEARIPELLKVQCSWRGISAEPLRGPLDLIQTRGGTPWIGESVAGNRLDLVITGGESGRQARAIHPDHFRSLRDQCQMSGTPFFFKQWGEWVGGKFDWRKGKAVLDDGGIFWTNTGHPPITHWEVGIGNDYWKPCSARVGKKRPPGEDLAGKPIVYNNRLLDGREWNEFPDIAGNSIQQSTAHPQAAEPTLAAGHDT
jgi:protein gp37